MSSDTLTAGTLPRQKPRLRGVSHHFACLVSLGGGLVLVGMAPSPRAAAAGAVYALSLTWLFGVSAVYHRPTWEPRIRTWLRRLDHASIFVLIGGTYTPVCMLALPPETSRPLLFIVWTGVLMGVVQSLVWVQAPKVVTALLYLALGWVALPYAGALGTVLGPAGIALLVAGGVAYSLGALVYALRRPDPVPAVFGYHEVFHALVIVASILHFAAVILILRGAR